MDDEEIEESYQAVTCDVCYVKFWVPVELEIVGRMRGADLPIWCPNGHTLAWKITKPDDGDGDGGEVVAFPVIKGSKS